MADALAFFQSSTTPKATFQYSADRFYDHRINDHVPEVCILGCSNAGKSTFVNALLGHPLARSSSTPGYTKLMNVFACGPFVPRAEVARWAAAYAAARRAQRSSKPIPRLGAPRALVLVDSPGYGFNSRGEWGAHIEKYLRQRRSLRGIVLLLRAELALTQADAQMLEMLAAVCRARHGAASSGADTSAEAFPPVSVTIILTRADRCAAQQRGKSWVAVCAERVREIRECIAKLRGTAGAGGWVPQIYVSAAGMAGSVATARDEAVRVRRVGEHAGMGGARVAVLKMAGIIEPDRAARTEKREGGDGWERLEATVEKRERGWKRWKGDEAVGYKVQREVKKMEVRQRRAKSEGGALEQRPERGAQELSRKDSPGSLVKDKTQRKATQSLPPDSPTQDTHPKTKLDEENISPQNKALEQGESGHTGYNGQVVSFEDLMSK
ncbi:hypothetical protein BROUX41_005765 [Berkeleyomyces rouxiae]|uniref:uncharacterized protein n=1 Tax=Berkeleyomyces rouxiae TaxID=2035830 RepID=UPI003B7F5683